MILNDRKSLSRAKLALALGWTALFAACESSLAPVESAAGIYTATSFFTTTNGQMTNHLANGSTISLTLHPDRTTSGHMHVEAAGAVPAFDADLTGTWTQDRFAVQLDHAADTFLRDMVLNFDGISLGGDMTVSGTRIQVILTRLGDD